MYNQYQNICISKFINPMFIPSLKTISSKSLGPFHGDIGQTLQPPKHA